MSQNPRRDDLIYSRDVVSLLLVLLSSVAAGPILRPHVLPIPSRPSVRPFVSLFVSALFDLLSVCLRVFLSLFKLF